MTLYEYRCPACGYTTTQFRRLSARDDSPYCPKIANCERMYRVITPVHLHGSPNMPND